MIRWCAYCQRYQGEVEPFDDYSMTHTICDRCVTNRAYERQQPQELESIRRFFTRVAGAVRAPAPRASDLVAEGAALGLDPVDLLLGIVQPVLHRIGERWARSQATIADEHRVTAVCSKVIQMMRDREAQGSAAVLRNVGPPAVLLVSAEGNCHTLGIQILEVFLLRNQVSTLTVQSGLSVEEIVSLGLNLSPRVLGISAALPEQVQSVVLVAQRVVEQPAAMRPRVVLGGLALRGANALPPDAPLQTCRDLHAFLELTRQVSSTAA